MGQKSMGSFGPAAEQAPSILYANGRVCMPTTVAINVNGRVNVNGGLTLTAGGRYVIA